MLVANRCKPLENVNGEVEVVWERCSMVILDNLT